MKFIYADSLDFVDPNYDFLTDRSPVSREMYWDDLYPHEIHYCLICNVSLKVYPL